jgi:hypothetical protein
MKVSALSVNPTNDEIYDKTDLSSLIKSIKENGLLEPLVVTKGGQLISGHRRLAAIKELGWEDVEVRVVEPENEVIALIEHNRYRTKTERDILRESRFLEKELKKRIGRGRNAAKERGGEKLKLDLELAKRLNVGTTKLKQLRSIENYQPQLLDEIDKGKISVSKAYQSVRSQFVTKPVTKPKNRFPTELRKVIQNYQPSLTEIHSVINTTYPYSLETLGVTEFDRNELRNHLKELVGLDSVELMLKQKQDELTEANIPKSKLHYARNLLPTNQELDQFWTDVITHRVKKEGPNPLDELVIISPHDDLDGFSSDVWTTLRQTISHHEFWSGPGRKMSFFVGFQSKKGFRLLGIASFASDSQRLLVRDEYIGWDDLMRGKNREHLVNMNTCVATQPFGHNRLGMKLLCSIVPRLVEKWEAKYETTIAAITTTSLHGQGSAYQGMKWWRSIGITSGSQLIAPMRIERDTWFNRLKDNLPNELDATRSQSSPLQAKLKLLYRCLGLPEDEFQHSHKRGVFMCPLYDNWKEFLRGEVKVKQLKSIEIDWQDWWVKKARTRYENLKKEERLEENVLFYDGIEDLSYWLEVRGV